MKDTGTRNRKVLTLHLYQVSSILLGQEIFAIRCRRVIVGPRTFKYFISFDDFIVIEINQILSIKTD